MRNERFSRSKVGQVGECAQGPADAFFGTRQVARIDVMAGPRAEFDAASERNRVWRMPIDEADKAALAQLRKRT